MNKKNLILLFGLFVCSVYNQAQVWQPDNGDGTYRNPIIHADYSDPDVIRVGDDYYMVASSFTCFPGIPVLHSRDLVNWTIVNHIYTALPNDRYTYPAHGQGSWAPSIRYHKERFYVYFCTPEEGLFVAYTNNPMEEWTLKHVLHVALWEDPCPFWDDNGDVYLVRSKLCGGPAYLHKMSEDGLSILDNGQVVYWDESENPTLEGLKMMKRNGYYYILAPAGGVPTGWQTVLRSKQIYGPYEAKRVLAEGNGVNGPHQGGLVDTQTGEWWFVHFQDKDAYGRVVHLQPARWINDWPVMGIDEHNEECGLPVLTYKKPDVGSVYPAEVPQTTDEFTDNILGLQWQWQAMEQKSWYSLTENPGYLRLYPIASPTDQGNLHYAGNLLLQKLPAPEFTVSTKLILSALNPGERAGLVVMGEYHTYLSVSKGWGGENAITLFDGKEEVCGYPPHALRSEAFTSDTIWLKVTFSPNATCRYAYSEDGNHYTPFNDVLQVSKGRWIGAKVGLFCIHPEVTDGKGFVDIDYFRVSPPAQ